MIDKLTPFSRRRRISRYAHKVQVHKVLLAWFRKLLSDFLSRAHGSPIGFLRLALKASNSSRVLAVSRLESCQQLLNIHPKNNPFLDEKMKNRSLHKTFCPTRLLHDSEKTAIFIFAFLAHTIIHHANGWRGNWIDFLRSRVHLRRLTRVLWVKKFRENEPLECEHMCALWNPRSWAAFYDKLLKREQPFFLLPSTKMSLTCRRLWSKFKQQPGNWELRFTEAWTLEQVTTHQNTSS